MDKWYIHNPASVLENDTYKFLWDFDIQTDYLILDRRSDLKVINKKKEKPMKHEGDDYTYHDWCFWYSHQRINKGTGGLGGWRMSGDHPNYYIIENSQNTEKSPGDLRRLVITETSVKDYQLMLMRKTLKEY